MDQAGPNNEVPTRRGLLSLAVFVVVAMTASVLQTSPAHAGGIITTVPITIQGGGLIELAPDTGEVVLLSGIDTSEVLGQCFDLGNGNVSCLGHTGPLRVENEWTTERLIARPDAHGALGPLVEEAALAVGGIYDVPADDRVERYARDEVRAYLVNRLLAILDRAAYGLPLDATEQRALQFLQSEVQPHDALIAQAAWDEWQAFSTQGCGYQPPPTPAYVINAVAVPPSVTSGCRGSIGLGSVFSPPVPTAEHFQAWGLYRVANQLGLESLGDPVVQDSMAGVARAGVLGGGILTAAGAAALTSSILAGSGSAVATKIGFAMSMTAIKSNSPALAGIFGTSAGTALVAVIILAIVALALAIWQLAEAQQVGATLAARRNATQATTDPFGLAALRLLTEGRNLEEDRLLWTDSEIDRPPYRTDASVTRLTEYVTRWTMITSSGTVKPDPTGLWADNATTAADHRFRVTDAGGGNTFTDVIALPTPDGLASVRFNDGWLVVTPQGGQPHPQLNLEYLDEEGNPAWLARHPQEGGGQHFAVSRPQGSPDELTTIQPTITYRAPDDSIETVQIVPSIATVAAGARPSVAGRLLPGEQHYLRPNAVTAAGDIDDGAFISDYDATWTVERLDETSNTWVADTVVSPDLVGANETWGARFTPTEAGQFRAQVTLEHRTGAAPDAVGSVEFAVIPPPIEILQLDVVDDHVQDELAVSVQVSEPVIHDEVTIDVTWPGTVDSDDPGPTSSAMATCAGSRPCGTPVVHLTQPVGVLTDLHELVTVTVTNSYGGQVTTSLPIETPNRPSFVMPWLPPDPAQPGEVTFDDDITHIQIPADVDDDPNYVVAGIEPAPGEVDPSFILTDPDDPGPPKVAIDVRGDGTFLLSVGEQSGQPVLVLRGVPGMEDLGTYEVPVVIQQSNGARRTLRVLIDVVPAPNDRYRAALLTDVDPLDFTVDRPPATEIRLLGGQDEWGPYDGDLCVGLTGTDLDNEYCAPVAEFFSPEGDPLPFPFPKLAPHGLDQSDGIVRIRTWLSEGDHTFPEPSQETFAMANGTAPPVITELTWSEITAQAALAAEPGAPENPIESVQCTVDGVAVTPCFGTGGGIWTPPDGLPEGPKVLEVIVTDTLGNYDTAAVTFDLGDPTVSASEASVAEGHGPGTTILALPVTLSHAVPHEVTVDWTTLHVASDAWPMATPGEDYNAASGTLTFAPGQTTAHAEIEIIGDTVPESDETTFVVLSNAGGGIVAHGWDRIGWATIVDDELPKVVPETAVVVADYSEEVVGSVPVTLSQPSSEEVTVSWQTVYDGSRPDIDEAEPGEDYTSASGVVTFAPGQTTASVEITVAPNILWEPDEIMVVWFHSPTGALIGGLWGLGALIITDPG